MKRVLFATIFFTLLISCKKDESRSCILCNSPETFEFEVCRESNGNASVNGDDTGTNYDVYISDLEATGVTCGGS